MRAKRFIFAIRKLYENLDASIASELLFFITKVKAVGTLPTWAAKAAKATMGEEGGLGYKVTLVSLP
jgi:hypothetical protein